MIGLRSELANTRKFVPLFAIQFLNAMSDHVLKNAILVLINYEGLTLLGLSKAISVSLSALLFTLPFFIFSAYAGNLADNYSKTKLIRLIKYWEVAIVIAAAVGLSTHHLLLMIIALILMGVHSTFFGPIKYSILPNYINSNHNLLVANGLIELGTFCAVLGGQTLGSWFTAEGRIELVVAVLTLSTVLGLGLSFRLEPVAATGPTPALHWNIVKHSRQLMRLVTSNRDVSINLHTISWFWGIGTIYATQLVLLTSNFLGGGAHVFSAITALFSIAIGVGSLLTSVIAAGTVNRRFVVAGGVIITLFTWLLLAFNQVPTPHSSSLSHYLSTSHGLLNFGLVFCIGLGAGMYSVTCYNEIQLTTPPRQLSRVIAVNNILNAMYMVAASIIVTVLLIYIDAWWLFVVVSVLNLIVIFSYLVAHSGHMALVSNAE